MTRDAVLAMKPGRELDALVAEKVMGWKTNWLKTNWYEEINPNTHRHKGSVTNFKPSTDISAAFEVWEHDRPDNWTMNLLSPRKGIYKAEIIEHTGKGIRWLGIVESESAAEAMVKCRLLAVMDGEDERNA